VDRGVVYVDPPRFVAVVADGFDQFCGNIQSDPEMGKRFNTYWEHKETVNLLPLEAKMRRSGELPMNYGLGTGAFSSLAASTLAPPDPSRFVFRLDDQDKSKK
jgi:hypothetical protein